MDNTQGSESPVVMWTSYKRVDGFEVSLTLRGTDVGLVATELDKSIKTIITNGGAPVSRQKSGYPPKPPVEYVEGAQCPTDGGRIIKGASKDGTKRFEKCENNKYNWQTKQQEGCDYIKWL